jgi:hypothetical protein
VQWEPVVTIDNPFVIPRPFPSPAGFFDDGGPTLLGAADVTLVPVAPAPLLEQVVNAYNNGGAAGVLFTLPFGMIAVATLPSSGPHPLPIPINRPGLTEISPDFTPPGLTGGRQVSLTAASTEFDTGSPSLPGATVQLHNLLDANGNPILDPSSGAPLSVLGPDVDHVFNDEFGPGKARASVPLSRIDLSGYGGSAFSDWTDPQAVPPATAVVQVHFDMMVGRTCREVVKVRSILYPWQAIVVRTITIDRQDDTEVFRHDSGWVAATAGTFTLGGITVHPGAVLGAFNIREIRDTSQTVQAGGGAELVAVYFDADIQIDGVLAGATSGGLVPSTGQLGFVQIAPVGQALKPDQLAILITSQGRLGGPVDCLISVAGTPQTMRLHRVEVDNAPQNNAAETPEFAAAARGSVVLPQSGSWSVLQRTDSVSEPTPIDPDRGVPLIRQGPAGSPPPDTPWRLAEPFDLWFTDNPDVDYCLLHSTDSTRVLFPRPEIKSGQSAFTSDQVPVFADAYALMNSSSVCPRQDSCLSFPDANYALQINGAGQFTLTGLPTSFPPNLKARTMATSSAATIAFEYADANGTPAQISLSITPDAWAIDIQNTNLRIDINPFGAIFRTVADVAASSTAGLALNNPRMVLGSILTPLQEFLTFLEQLGFPDPFKVAVSNKGSASKSSPSAIKYKINAQLVLSPEKVPALKNLDTPFGKLDISVKIGAGNAATSTGALATASSNWSANFGIDGSAQVALPSFPLLKVGGLMGLKLGVDFPAGNTPQTETITFQVGFIATLGGDLIPPVVSLKASISIAFVLVQDTTPNKPSIGVGSMMALSASGAVLGGLVAVTFTAEAMAIIVVTEPRSLRGTFDVSVDVTVCWFVSVSFSESADFSTALF